MITNNFWKDLPKPFFALAPMEDVTDTVFRELVISTASAEKLQVVFTEFLSVDGYLHDIARDKVKHRLFVSEAEKEILNEKGIKIVAQIWGSDPEKFYQTARDLTERYAFDGIDINMGCPMKKIIKNNACSALINFPDQAKEIILASKEGTSRPVSVKTRIGVKNVETERWMNDLLQVNPAAITVHGRTQKMQSEGFADWNEIKKAVQLRNSLNSDTLIIGNGDVGSYEDGLSKSREFLVDGAMIGRGIFKNPAFFTNSEQFDHHERIHLLRKHIDRYRTEWEGVKDFSILKRFFKIYVHSFEGASEFRGRLVRTNSYDEALSIIGEIEKIEPDTTNQLVQ